MKGARIAPFHAGGKAALSAILVRTVDRRSTRIADTFTPSMNRLLLLPLASLLPGLALAASLSGTLTAGGGIDDLSVTVRSASGQKIDVYCDQQCGDWFDEDKASEGYRLKKKLVGKQVLLDYRKEPNRDRIAGPGANDLLNFVKKIELLK